MLVCYGQKNANPSPTEFARFVGPNSAMTPGLRIILLQ